MKPVAVKLIRFLIALALTPIVVAILALLVINVVDWDKHRGFVTKMIEKFTDYRVDSIEGIKVGRLTSAEAGVDGIKLHHKTGLGALKNLETKQTYLRLKVFPLLFSDKLILQNFILNGARVDLQKVKVDPKTESAEEDSEGGLTLADLPSIFIHSATIKDFKLTYAGTTQGEPLTVKLDNAGVTAPYNDKPSMLSAEGQVGDLPFEMAGAFGSFDAFRDPDAAYPARIKAKIADHTLEARGNLKFREGVSHFDVDASGPGLARLKQALKLNIGDIPAYSLSFALNKKPDAIRFEQIRMQLGRTQVLGNGGLSFAEPKLLVTADLKSPRLYATDFKGLFQSSGKKELRDPTEPARPAGQYFSDKPIELDAIKMIDADIKITVDKFEGEKAGTAIDGIQGRVMLNAGRLVVDPLRFAVAEGVIGGDLVFDARRPDIKVKIALGARSVNLNSLLGRTAKDIPVMKIKPNDVAKGILTGHLDIKMHGRSPMQLAKTVEGPIQLAVEGGKIASTFIELAGIDITQALGDWIVDHPLISLECGLVNLEADEGVYRTKSFIIATGDSNIVGQGQLNLPGNNVDFKLTTHPRDFSIGSVKSPILIRGKLNEIKVGLDPKPLVARGAAALLLGAINPALALLPLVEPGLGKKGACDKYAGELKGVIASAEKDVTRKDLQEAKSVGR
jgi:uncharacterized protein involved in outer membrane biogenesis